MHLVPDTETVDSLAVVKVLAYFDIGVPVANVTQWLGTAVATPGVAGIPSVDTVRLGGTVQTGADVGGMVADTVADLDELLAGVVVTTNNDKTGYALTAGERTSIADAMLDETAGIETNRTVRQGLRIMLASLAGKLSGAALTTVRIRDTNDTRDRIVATVDENGDRLAVTLDGS